MTITEKIEELEKQITEHKKELVNLRAQDSTKGINNYKFQTHDGGNIQLSELFGDRNELIMPFNMGKKCVYCTLWADGYNGILHHLENRSAFTVVSPDPIDVQKKFYKSRNWNFKMVSCEDMQFYKDMDMFNGEDSTWPGVASLIKNEDGKIFRYAKSNFGPGDNYCIMWDFNDILPVHDPVWAPEYQY